MAMGVCRECGKPASDEAKVCPNCGVANPVKKKTSAITWIVVAFIGVAVISGLAGQGAGPSSSSAAATNEGPIRITDPDILRQQNEALAREAINAMPIKELSAKLRGDLLKLCETANPRLNYIKVIQMNGGLFCQHDFFNQYTTKSGGFGPALAEFTAERHDALVRAKIKKIGVAGTGDYSSSSWYDVQ